MKSLEETVKEQGGEEFLAMVKEVNIRKWGVFPRIHRGPPPPCIRIGVMKDNFVFDHFLQFSDYKNVQLG